MLQWAEYQHFLPGALNQKRLRSLAAGGPEIQNGVERGTHVFHQPDASQSGGAIVERHQHAEEREGKERIAAWLHQYRLVLGQRPCQGIDLGLWSQAQNLAPGCQQQVAPRVHQVGRRVERALLQDAQALAHGGLLFQPRKLDPARHQLGKGRIVCQSHGLGGLALAPFGHAAHLQLADGLQLPLDLMAKALLALTVGGQQRPHRQRQQ